MLDLTRHYVQNLSNIPITCPNTRSEGKQTFSFCLGHRFKGFNQHVLKDIYNRKHFTCNQSLFFFKRLLLTANALKFW